jgi:hypothetical protein
MGRTAEDARFRWAGCRGRFCAGCFVFAAQSCSLTPNKSCIPSKSVVAPNKLSS